MPDHQLKGGQHSVRFAYRMAGAVLLVGSGMAALLPVALRSGAPPQLEAARRTLYVACGIAACLGVVFLTVRRLPPRWVLYAAPPFVTLLICSPSVVAGTATPAGDLLLIWPLMFAAYFLPERVTWATMVVALAAFGAVAARIQTRGGLNVWIEMAATLSLTTCFVVALRRKVDRLTDELRSQASHDPLTGLANRRAFDAFLERELARRARTETTLSLLALDIDHFKRVNDRSGHPAGDAVLQSLAALLTSNVRADDLVARIGGEEFFVVIPGCEPDHATFRAEGLRKSVESESAAWPDPITVSVGVATVPDDGATAADLIASSDAALYAAKQAGRNRVRSGAGSRR